MLKKCGICAVEFKGKSKSLYCSIKCRGISRRARQNMKCLNCQIEFYPSGSAKGIFCNKQCMIEYERIHHTRDYSHLRKARYKKVDRICKICNIIITNTDINKTICGDCLNDRENRKEYLVNLAGGKCIKCGYNKCLRAMSFHHRNPNEKLFSLDKTSIRYKSLNEILLEYSKCDLLCQNCHSETHEIERNHTNIKNKSQKLRKELRKTLAIISKGGCCARCGYKSIGIQCMTFHHLNKNLKSFPLDGNAFIRKKKELIDLELEKCILLCSNCHMEVESQ